MYAFPDLEPVWNHWLEPVWNAYSMFHSNWAYTNNLNQEVKDNITSITRHVDIIIPAALLLLSRFSRVRLYVTPQTAAHQAPPSLGFSRQEHWSGPWIPNMIRNITSGVLVQNALSQSNHEKTSNPNWRTIYKMSVQYYSEVERSKKTRKDWETVPNKRRHDN